MTKLWKKLLLAALCICTLSTGVALMPARAAGHICSEFKVTKKEGPQSYSYKDDMSHNAKYLGTYSCIVCGNVKSVENIDIPESHKFTLHESLGHSGSYHTYRIICGCCGYSRQITIKCIVDSNGRHTPPF